MAAAKAWVSAESSRRCLAKAQDSTTTQTLSPPIITISTELVGILFPAPKSCLFQAISCRIMAPAAANVKNQPKCLSMNNLHLKMGCF
jgi:hypothetical protein